MKKKKDLEKQYNPFAEKYTGLHVGENHTSTDVFFKIVAKYLSTMDYSKRLIDLGCGAGTDFDFYSKQHCLCAGVDSSLEMVTLAKQKNRGVIIREESFSGKTTFQRSSFNVAVSKWAVQTAERIDDVYRYVNEVLVSQGYFIFLTVHPLRQFLEKKKSGKDYFKQEIVASEIFNKQITVYEPTHTIQEYFSPHFLEHFELLEIKEDYEFPAAEQIGGDIYPTYLIVVARKK